MSIKPKEGLIAWYSRLTDSRYDGNMSTTDIEESGFAFIKMAFPSMFSQTVYTELTRMSVCLFDNGITNRIIMTYKYDNTRLSWLLFENDTDMIQALLILEIHPDYIV